MCTIVFRALTIHEPYVSNLLLPALTSIKNMVLCILPSMQLCSTVKKWHGSTALASLLLHPHWNSLPLHLIGTPFPRKLLDDMLTTTKQTPNILYNIYIMLNLTLYKCYTNVCWVYALDRISVVNGS